MMLINLELKEKSLLILHVNNKNLYNIIYFILIVITLGISQVGKTSLIET